MSVVIEKLITKKESEVKMLMPLVIPEEENDTPNVPEVRKQFGIVLNLWAQLNDARGELAERVKKFQSACQHEFKDVTRWDGEYCGRVDGSRRGMNIYLGRKCAKCKLFEPRRQGHPHLVCHKCGGDMERHHIEHCADIRVHVHKCKTCGHEHDTT